MAQTQEMFRGLRAGAPVIHIDPRARKPGDRRPDHHHGLRVRPVDLGQPRRIANPGDDQAIDCFLREEARVRRFHAGLVADIGKDDIKPPGGRDRLHPGRIAAHHDIPHVAPGEHGQHPGRLPDQGAGGGIRAVVQRGGRLPHPPQRLLAVSLAAEARQDVTRGAAADARPASHVVKGRSHAG